MFLIFLITVRKSCEGHCIKYLKCFTRIQELYHISRIKTKKT